MRVLGKVLRVAGKTAVGVLIAVALLVGITWSFVQTRRGSELVRRLALPRLNDALAGTLTLRKLAFGGDRLTLEDVAVYDPEGNFVGRVARVDVWFSPLALLRRHVDVSALEIRRPELALVQDARGLNLLRALAPRHPAPAAASPPGAPARGAERGPAIDVHALSITGGTVDYRSSDGGDGRDGGSHLHVADLSVRGAAHVAGPRVAVDAKIRARGGHVEARGAFDTDARSGDANLRAAVRGLALAVDGRVDGGALAAHARVDAVDLAATARALARDFALDRIPMSGNGRLEIDAGGTLEAPSLRAAAHVPALGIGDNRVNGLDAAAHIPDVRAPESLDLDARAASLALGAQRLHGVTVAARTAGRNVSLHAAIAGPQPLRVELAGKRAAGNERSITIGTLAVAYPDATWTLRRPARLSYGDTLALSGFELGAGAQRLAIDLRAAGRSKTAHVVVAHLDLGRLPRALVPPEAGLGGTLDADVHLQDGARPRVVATAALTGGRVRNHRDLSFKLAARLERGRARGQLDARAPGLTAAARFDLPGEWPPRRDAAPIDLDLEIADADLATIAKTLADARGTPAAHVAGHARASIKLDGSIARPRLHATVAGHGLAADGRSMGELAVAANVDGTDKLAARIDVTAPVRAHLEVAAPLSLAALLRRPPTAAALARTPFEASGTLDRLPIEALARLAGQPGRVGGTVSAKLALKGTAGEPQGTLAVDVAGATMPRVPPTDTRLEVDFDGHAVAARARVTRRSRPLVALEGRVEASPGDLAKPARLEAAPISLRAVFGPFALQRLGLPPVTDREPARALNGKLHADLTVDGTIGAPRALFHAQVADVELDKTAVGFAEIEARYAERQAKLDARLTSRGGGTLRATAALKADLGYPAVARAGDLGRAPLEARLDAQRFDLQGLSGVTPELRALGGLLTASVTVQGTVAAPRPTGRLEWTDGVLSILGFGDYRQIHLALHGDDSGVVLDELTTASGSGHARATGNAKRIGVGRYEVTLDTKLQRLPIYSEGQPLAVVSLTSRLRGTAAPPDAKLDLDIDEARVELPDNKRKELQPLAEPHDIVLVEGGAPLNRAQAEKLRALTKAAAAPAGPPAHTPKLRVHVNSPRHLWVTGKDVYLELGVSPDFRVSLGGRTQVFGQVTVHRGRVDVFSRRFDIKSDSTLTFGGSPDHPDLDVRAEHVNTTENVTVVLTAKGPIDKLAITVTSPNRPDLSESQLYTLIVSGRLNLGGGAPGAAPQMQAASILGGVLASKLQSSLSHRLPFDVLTIDVGGEGMRGTTLEAGRYVTDRLYVGYVGRVASDPTRYQNRNAVHLEFQISSRWEIEGEYGDLGTGTADLMWKKSY
jgi:translocation and assembly module TamB